MGSFALAEVTVELLADGQERSLLIPLSQVWASAGAKGGPLRNVIDGDSETAWGFGEQPGGPHAAVFLLQEPLGSEGKATLTLTLQHGGASGAAIGKFRISVAGARSAANTEDIR
jgi:hypothetical protein